MRGERLVDRARDRWRSLLPQLGVDARLLDGKHHACPICRDGKDRFRFDNLDGRGTWICAVCGAGDGVDLVKAVNRIEFREAAERIESLLGVAPVETTRGTKPTVNRDAMNALWASSTPVSAGDPVGRWLWRRVGMTTFPACLRTALHVRYDAELATFHPAMIAMVRGPDGTPAHLHRTYLTKDGQKAAVEKPRLVMPGSIPKGSAIRLAPAGEVLGVAEGIESALAASSLFAVPVWSTMNTAIMAGWEPPSDVRKVIVFGDNDPKFGGAAAAYALAHRLAVRDREVEVRIPDRVGADWNDILLEVSDAA